MSISQLGGTRFPTARRRNYTSFFFSKVRWMGEVFEGPITGFNNKSEFS